MRGEYSSGVASEATISGPPPHAWGIPENGTNDTNPAGSTPTCVGNTPKGLSYDRGLRVHPHMRGEYLRSLAAETLAEGPPPHAWGIRPAVDQPQPNLGSTPTCVGNTYRGLRLWVSKSVHPHMRGEYDSVMWIAWFVAGPPPHAWGIQGRDDARLRRAGSTPTCVGNTPPRPSRAQRWPVHPHMRGEYDRSRQNRVFRDGPPPHAWGIRNNPFAPGLGCGSTPTCVGNTGRCWPPGRSPWVHPHMRGEYFIVEHYLLGLRGPPPHAWGILASTSGTRSRSRSTPTCVGNTSVGPPRRSCCWVHPHMRGEY